MRAAAADDDKLLRESMGFGSFGQLRKRKRHGQAKLPQQLRGAPEIEWFSCAGSDATETETKLGLGKLHMGGGGPAATGAPHPCLSCPGLEAMLLKAKLSFRCVERQQFCAARARANPHEALGRGPRAQPYLNRAALKLASLDALCGLSRLASASEPLLFADLCGGPGGFSQYLLRKRRSPSCDDPRGAHAGGGARGWGMSLRDGSACDWDASALHPYLRDARDGHTAAGACALELVDGEDGSGDICRVRNVAQLVRVAREGAAAAMTCSAGDKADGAGGAVRDAGAGPLHLVVADGGFEEARNHAQQEHVAARLILAQSVAALQLLRRGGAFVLKMFGAAAPTTASLVLLLARLFDALAVVKPVTSRPASGERYLVCRGFAEPRHAAALLQPVTQHMLRALCHYDSCASASATSNLVSLVPPAVLAEDKQFCAFLRRSNDQLARAQLDACTAIQREVDEGSTCQLDVGGSSANDGHGEHRKRRKRRCTTTGVARSAYWALWGI